jgi:Chorismate synthase
MRAFSIEDLAQLPMSRTSCLVQELEFIEGLVSVPRALNKFCFAGVGDGVTLGTPICIMVPNEDQKSQDYSEMEVAYRPSHADATYDMKYGIRAVAGGGRSSARETIGRVAAGAVAKKLLKVVAGVEVSWTSSPQLQGTALHYSLIFGFLAPVFDTSQFRKVLYKYLSL